MPERVKGGESRGGVAVPHPRLAQQLGHHSAFPAFRWAECQCLVRDRPALREPFSFLRECRRLGHSFEFRSSHTSREESQRLASDLPTIRNRCDEPTAPCQRWVTPMPEVPSRTAPDGTSFGVKRLVRKEAVELAVLNERGLRFPLIPP
jgi:hypothetical protein